MEFSESKNFYSAEEIQGFEIKFENINLTIKSTGMNSNRK
jgi:hypothetical protein